MKLYSLVFPILLLATQFSIAQERPQVRKIAFKISVSDSISKLKGHLYNISDTSVNVSSWPIRFRDVSATPKDSKELGYAQISEITLKRTHGAGRGALLGALAGAFIGAVAGFAQGDDPADYWFRMTAADKAIILGGTGAMAGAGIGALIGALAKKKFIIGGKKERFDEMQMNILNKAYGLKPSPQN